MWKKNPQKGKEQITKGKRHSRGAANWRERICRGYGHSRRWQGTVMLEGMCGMKNCTRANRKMRKHRWKLREEIESSKLAGRQKKWVTCSGWLEAWKNERGGKNKPADTHANLSFLKESYFRKAWEEECNFTNTYLQSNVYVQILPHILICDRGAAKSNNKKMLILVRQVFFLISYLFLQQTIFINSLDNGSTVWENNSYNIFWL